MADSIEVTGVTGIPLVEPGDDIAALLLQSLDKASISLQDGDCLVVAQKIISKSENRYVELGSVNPTANALALAKETDKDPRLVQLILDESVEVLRYREGAIIVEHKLGIVHANAGIDQSNIPRASGGGQQVLLLPENPDRSASTLRETIKRKTGRSIAVIISDSAGRAWRNGITGFAIGTAGFTAVVDQTGKPDLFDRPLRVTSIAVADELAAAASLVMGQADEAIPAVIIRGARLADSGEGSRCLIRDKREDLFR